MFRNAFAFAVVASALTLTGCSKCSQQPTAETPVVETPAMAPADGAAPAETGTMPADGSAAPTTAPATGSSEGAMAPAATPAPSMDPNSTKPGTVSGGVGGANKDAPSEIVAPTPVPKKKR